MCEVGMRALIVLLLAVVGGAAELAGQVAPPADLTRHEAGRFTVVAFPAEARLARSLLAAAQARDSFPGLPRLGARVTIALAPDERRFREWVGAGAPEWGAAIAFPAEQRIIMHGRDAAASASAPYCRRTRPLHSLSKPSVVIPCALRSARSNEPCLRQWSKKRASPRSRSMLASTATAWWASAYERCARSDPT